MFLFPGNTNNSAKCFGIAKLPMQRRCAQMHINTTDMWLMIAGSEEQYV